MTVGFSHFDGAHRETFAAALILLCIDADVGFRTRFVALVRGRAGLAGVASLTQWGREEALDAGPDQKRRSDVWLRFDDGLVLVELKTHSRWNVAGVARQMRDQRRAEMGGQRVREAVLLAPALLLRQLSDIDCPKLSWHELFDLVDGIEHPGHVLELAREHWSQNVEREFGLPAGTAALPLDAAAAQTGCLVAFLRAAICRLDGKVQGDTVWFSSPDGRPRRRQQWAWIGIAVRGRLPSTGDVYFGIYTYSAAPPGEVLGTFLEAYRTGHDDVPLASVPFAPGDLSPETLNAALEKFLGV